MTSSPELPILPVIFIALRAAFISVAMACGVYFQQMMFSVLVSYLLAGKFGWYLKISGVVIVATLATIGIFIGEIFWNPEPVAGSLLTYFSAILILVFGTSNQAFSATRVTALRETDSLTGLSNRHGIERRLDELINIYSYDGSITIAITDCDHFKKFNDTQGHRAGDQFLVEVANLLNTTDEDYFDAGRLGGDEFCVAWIGLSPDEAQQDTLELKAELNEISSEWDRKIRWSMGVAHYTTPRSVEEMIDQADRLMLGGKRRRKNSFTFRVDPTEHESLT